MPSLFPGSVDTPATLGVSADGVSVTLTAPMMAGDTTAQVDNAVNVPQWALITFGAELMQVSLVSGNTLTFGTPGASPSLGGRGLSGTTVAAHNTGTSGYLNVNAWYQQALASAVIALEASVAGVVSLFTPVLAFGGVSTGITYSQQAGDYIRNGSLITARIAIHLTSKGTAAGAASIGGLPVSANNLAAAGWSAPIFATENMANLDGPTAEMSENSPNLTLYGTSFNTNGSFSSVMTDANFTDSSYLQLSVTYHV